MKRWLYMLDAIIVIALIALVGYMVWRSNTPHITAGGGCSQYGQQYTVFLNHNTFSTAKLDLRQCDQIKVVNQDSQDYELAFGAHDSHIQYPGFNGRLLQTGDSEVINVVRSGVFPLHDHLRDQAVVELVILPL